MDSKSKITNIAYDDRGNCLVTFLMPRLAKDELQALKDEELTLTVKKFKKKKSLDANAYAWVLMDKLAKATGIPKDEIYQNYMRNVGGNSQVVGIEEKNKERFKKDWSNHGLGWQTEMFPSRTPGWIYVICYEGSSEFDSEQMSKLIDLIIQDCKACDIETDTPEEIAKRLERWKNEC